MKAKDVVIIVLLAVIALQLGYLINQFRPRPRPPWPYDLTQKLQEIPPDGFWSSPDPYKATTVADNLAYIKCQVALQMRMIEKILIDQTHNAGPAVP